MERKMGRFHRRLEAWLGFEDEKEATRQARRVWLFGTKGEEWAGAQKHKQVLYLKNCR
jgi:hypothetical protein